MNSSEHPSMIKLMIKLIRANDKILSSLIDNHSNTPIDVDKSNLNSIHFKPMLTEEFKIVLKESKNKHIDDKKKLIEIEPMLKYIKPINTKKPVKITPLNHSELKDLAIRSRKNVDRKITSGLEPLEMKKYLLTKKDQTFMKEFKDAFMKFEKEFIKQPNSKVMLHLISPNVVIKKSLAGKIISVEESVRLLQKSKTNQDKTVILMENIFNIYTSYKDDLQRSHEKHKIFKKIVSNSFDDIISKYEESLNNNYDILLKNKRILQENERENKRNQISNLSDDNLQIVRELEKRGFQDVSNDIQNTDEVEFNFVQSTDDE